MIALSYRFILFSYQVIQINFPSILSFVICIPESLCLSQTGYLGI